ncbi:MAG: hypothetical protein ACMUHX_09295 [bacterium]
MRENCFKIKIRDLLAGMYILILFITCPKLSHAQIEHYSSDQIRQIPEEIMALMLKKDICGLIDLLEVPPIPKKGLGSFFSSPSGKQIHIRLQRDELLRRYIDCMRVYILIFSRFSITEESKITYNTLPSHAEDRFVSEIEIETFTSALADKIEPNLAYKKISVTFKVDFKYSEAGWRITNVYDFSYHPI